MSTFFTKDQAMALGVKLVGIAGGALVTRGVMTADQVSTIQADIPAVVGFFGVLYAIGYSLYANRKAKQIAKVAAMPEVDGVTVNSPALVAKVAQVDPSAPVSPSLKPVNAP